jgi:hypothetical protein
MVMFNLSVPVPPLTSLTRTVHALAPFRRRVNGDVHRRRICTALAVADVNRPCIGACVTGARCTGYIAIASNFQPGISGSLSASVADPAMLCEYATPSIPFGRLIGSAVKTGALFDGAPSTVVFKVAV